jgi:hypothetical protein
MYGATQHAIQGLSAAPHIHRTSPDGLLNLPRLLRFLELLLHVFVSLLPRQQLLESLVNEKHLK